MQSQKIRIRLKAFDYKLIDQSAWRSWIPPSAPAPS
jgi:ribosomal protein S10